MQFCLLEQEGNEILSHISLTLFKASFTNSVWNPPHETAFNAEVSEWNTKRYHTKACFWIF